MRQLSLQEVEVVSGADQGANTTLVEFTVGDALKWGAAYFGATAAFNSAASCTWVGSHPLAIPHVGLSVTKWAVGGVSGLLGGVGGYVAGHYLGQLFNSQVAARVG